MTPMPWYQPRPPSAVPHENDIQFMIFLAKLCSPEYSFEDEGSIGTFVMYKGVTYMTSFTQSLDQ